MHERDLPRRAPRTREADLEESAERLTRDGGVDAPSETELLSILIPKPILKAAGAGL